MLFRSQLFPEQHSQGSSGGILHRRVLQAADIPQRGHPPLHADPGRYGGVFHGGLLERLVYGPDLPGRQRLSPAPGDEEYPDQEFGFRFPTIRLYTTEPKRMACANDTLMSVRAPVGDLNVAHTDCCIGRGLAAIHSKTNHQSFVLYTMFSLKKQLNVFNGEGTVFGSINRNSLNDMPILIPPDDTIEAFERVVAPMDAAIRNNFDEICRLQEIRDSLLPKLMSGELDVSDIDL